MQFDTNNRIVKLCAEGMELEGEGRNEESLLLFRKAWEEAATDFERFVSAHYVARHQESVVDKLKWDETALQSALRINDVTVEGALPSLYLNVGKCYEDLHDLHKARLNYNLGLSYADSLLDDGYGNMIKGGIMNGLERVKNSH